MPLLDHVPLSEYSLPDYSFEPEEPPSGTTPEHPLSSAPSSPSSPVNTPERSRSPSPLPEPSSPTPHHPSPEATLRLVWPQHTYEDALDIFIANRIYRHRHGIGPPISPVYIEAYKSAFPDQPYFA